MDKLYAGVFGSFLSNSDEDFEEFLNVVRSVMADKPPARRSGLPWSTATLLWLAAAALLVLLCFHYLKLV
ncbi:ORF031 hypothetical protein [Bovine papular stomatitis virus]|uniref:IMV membrane protein n=1 Tax=Bovine papular stomatitis virus TaxID=129727 RepID=Q6TVF7_9POXV|nr:hypothetical protein BPSVgORF031 [Bovine papular stomatitis virus]AAR98388.1 ORF031 hypothetical protein [Bovine papular stomatitis virus]AKC03200.1 hypothetical protein BVTX09c15_031 [Bovine papular stomatitis virus]AKC03329.1 hypothetical protein BVTX09c5_031 [Bovine papular stomatitis virus]AKC03457.1 hypothetical protein BVTX09c1_031 [Bovine papular stomatitis virus]